MDVPYSFLKAICAAASELKPHSNEMVPIGVEVSRSRLRMISRRTRVISACIPRPRMFLKCISRRRRERFSDLAMASADRDSGLELRINLHAAVT